MKAWAIELNKKLKPITEAQKEYHRLRSAKYIFVHDKTGNATCSKCGSKINVGHTKHKQELICPNCTTKLNVQHEWRMSKKVEVINWMVIPKVIDNHTFCLRYVLAHQRMNEPMQVKEMARIFIDEYRAEAEYYCYRFDWDYYRTHNKEMDWYKGKNPYFVIPSYMTPNRFWCLDAYEYPRNFFKEINKLDCFKYYPIEDRYDIRCSADQLIYWIRSARLNEKLYKVGMTHLADYHKDYFRYHERCYPMNYNATSLMGMLKLDRPRYELLKQFPNSEMLLFLQKEKNLNINDFKETKYTISRYKDVKEIAEKIGVTFTKVNKYYNNVHCYEHKHYLSVLEQLGYDIKDQYYSLPKDFEKADKKITAEYNDMLKERQIEKASAKDELIKKISDGLRKMLNLQEFLNGSDGFLVYVPESARDLIEEGSRLHNCIGTYVDRIAEGKTMVFFVRQLNNPTAPFVAFEYANGEVVQCRYDHNKNVEDDNVINFIDRFVNALKAA